MSNFYGGSTIIKGGKFASHDPADDGFGYTARKKSNTQTSTKKSAQPTNKRKVASPQKILGSARKTLLHITIDQMLMGREAIKIPKTTHPDLLDALTAAGNPVTWAKNQTEFETLYAKKQKQRIERELRRKHKENTTPVEVEVKRKKVLKAQSTPQPIAKPEPTVEELYNVNRMALIRNLVDQMLKHQGRLSAPRIDSQLLDELRTFGSPLLWLQAQPEYASVFKARYLAKQKANAPAPKNPTQPPRKKKKGTEQKLVKDRVSSGGKATKGEAKKKRVNQYRDPYEKPSRPVKPLSDAPVDYILKQLNKTSEDTLDLRKIDWDAT